MKLPEQCEKVLSSKGAQPMPNAVHCSGCCNKHKCPQWDCNLGSLTQ